MMASKDPDVPIADVSWGAYHASRIAEKHITPAIVSLLPLFPDDSKSPAMIKHGMTMVKMATQVVNPGQVPVIAADQPLYAIAKQVQWKFPESHGESLFVIMLGSLHVEMAFQKVLGQWLEGSGWVESLVDAGVASHGRAESFLKACHVTRTRRAHQVTACALYILLEEAYGSFLETAESPIAINEWCAQEMLHFPTFYYWMTVLDMQLLLLIFIASLRDGNFPLYVQSLIKMMPWFFALNHHNYSRWLPIHIHDMSNLQSVHAQVHEMFLKGNFVVNKSTHRFSGLPLDHAHEQNNSLVKGDGGAIGLTQNPTALRRWTVGGPEVARTIQEFELSIEQQTGVRSGATEKLHHEQSPSKQTAFLKDVKALANQIRIFGNPFLEKTEDLIVLHSKDIIDPAVTDNIQSMESRGQVQFKEYMSERIETRTKSLYEPIKRNKLLLLSTPITKQMTSTASQISALKQDCNLFARLYIGSQSGDGDLDAFFAHENQSYPPSLSQFGNLRITNKSQLLPCIEDIISPQVTMPEVDALIMDGAAIVHMLPPRNSTIFSEYARNVFLPFLERILVGINFRLDIVFDVYRPGSLKFSVREMRGQGDRRRVAPATPVPKNWNGFLRNDANKTELFELLADEICTMSTPKLVVTTKGSTILSNKDCAILESIKTSTQEEADSRLLLHAFNANRSGYKKLMIKTVDTDVVVLSIAATTLLDADEMWVAFGTGQHLRYIPAHDVSRRLGKERSQGLPMFHSFSGCDTVSSFYGIGKKTAWNVWQTFDEVTAVFLSLSSPKDITSLDIEVLQRFTILLYDRTSEESEVNTARRVLFTQKNRSIESVPPTLGALTQHIRRAAYQAGHIWGQMFVACPEIPDAAEWGWKQTQTNEWKPLWTTEEDISSTCKELISCGCKKVCRGRCKCFKAALKCTELCKCGGHC